MVAQVAQLTALETGVSVTALKQEHEMYTAAKIARLVKSLKPRSLHI